MTPEERAELLREVKEDVNAAFAQRFSWAKLTSGVTLVGLALNLAALVWKDGQRAASMERYGADMVAIATRVTSLEMGATGQARTYMAANDEWRKATDARLVVLERAVAGVAQMQADVQVVRTLLERHESTKP